jgi:hypothetical protein
MQAREVEPPLAPTAPVEEGAAEAALGETIPQLREVLGPAEDRGMLEAEDALHLVRQRFEQTVDPEVQGEIAAELLEHVERQLELTRGRRRQLDSIEAKLWGRQNRLGTRPRGLASHPRSRRRVIRAVLATALRSRHRGRLLRRAASPAGRWHDRGLARH